jgi:hypothetical protein
MAHDLEASQPATEPARTRKAVYTIVERPGADKKFWVRIGTAFTNRDSSLNVHLDASPTNGQLHIRDWEPYDPSRRRSSGDSPAYGGAA